MTVPPLIGHTTSAHAETKRRNGYHGKSKPRKFDHDVAFAQWLAGMSAAELARRYGVHRTSIDNVIKKRRAAARSPFFAHGNGLPVEPDGGAARNGHHRTNGAAHSPQQSPPVADPPPPAVNGVAAGTRHAGEAGGLCGAPAGDPFNPVKEPNEKALVEAGAPIVRRQHDNDGDLVYVVSLPAANYVTHSRSLVDELLQPFESGSVQWVNEMGDAA